MGTLRNIPSQPAMLTLATRKSFSLTVQFVDAANIPLPLYDATVSFTIGEQTYSDTPILTQQASSIVASEGFALINLQASQLDLAPGVYPWEIVVTTAGYASIAASGELEMVESYEMLALGQTFDTAPATFSLVAQMRQNRFVITASSVALSGPPGPQGEPGVDGNPWGPVQITYNVDDRIESLTIDGETTTYSYNVDGTIAYDERNGITRAYTYTGDLLTSIDPVIGP